MRHDVDRRRPRVPAPVVAGSALGIALTAFMVKPLEIETGDITIFAAPLVSVTIPNNIASESPNYALEFFRTDGVTDAGRLDVARSSQDTTGVTANPLNFGGAFTIEGWIRADSDNDRGAGLCNQAGNGWVSGSILLDVDRNSGGIDNDLGISIGGDVLQFGIADGTNDYTICGSTAVNDGTWRHVAFVRDGSTCSIYVEGTRDVTTASCPTGSVAFVQGTTGSTWDHFITWAVEHHRVVTDQDYDGAIDEWRFSNVARYSGTSHTVPGRFTPDANTVGLFHFDEGSGLVVGNAATVSFDSFWDPDAAIDLGGSPEGPVWITSTAPTS